MTSMPDGRQVALAEVQYCLNLMVATLRHYHITHLLLDARHSIIEVAEKDYQALTDQFAQDLRGTRLQKIARVPTGDEQRETKVTQTTTALKQKEYFVIRVQTFPTPEEALAWLLAKDEEAD